MARQDADRVRVLKALALLGAVSGEVLLSSGELAVRMGISQQSASGKILELVREGLVLRRMGPRKQALQLTPRAVAVLRKEHSDYLTLFERPEKLSISGQVASGFGEGGYYVGQEHYQRQFRRKLGMRPFPGTLNLRLSGAEEAKLELLRQQPGIPIDGFENNGRTFGKGRCFRARLSGLECAVVIPDRTLHSDNLEIICEKHLRKSLGLKDGQNVRLEVLL
jgi:riboflavin kinase